MTVTIFLSPDGSVGHIESKWSNKASWSGIFLPEIEKSLKASSFAKGCAAKELTLIFNFEMGESLGTESKVVFGYPNQFWVTAPATVLQP